MYFLITKHLHKTFIAKIKVDHRKWPSFVINASESVFFFFSKYVEMGNKRSTFPSHIQRKKNCFTK